MSYMYKIGIIGDRDSICGFAAVGIDTFPVFDENSAKSILKRLAQEEYGIIYITEYYAELLKREIDEYSEMLTPSIIPIPSNLGSIGLGVQKVRGMVEKAVGSDILFGND